MQGYNLTNGLQVYKLKVPDKHITYKVCKIYDI